MRVEVSLQGDLITLSDVEGTAFDRKGEGGWINSARIVLSVVGIISLGRDTASVHDVLESVGRKTARAAVVVESLRAVNELLLCERREVAIFDKRVSLQSANSREGPA